MDNLEAQVKNAMDAYLTCKGWEYIDFLSGLSDKVSLEPYIYWNEDDCSYNFVYVDYAINDWPMLAREDDLMFRGFFEMDIQRFFSKHKYARSADIKCITLDMCICDDTNRALIRLAQIDFSN